MKILKMVKAKCLEIECPHWGWVKINFNKLDFEWWEDCRDSDLEISVDCVCGEKHKIRWRW